jgi:hypothetical protein
MRVITLILALVATACTADIRPDDTMTDATAQARGRALLERAWAAHGGDAWSAHQTATFTYRDTWQGVLGRLGNPWPERSVRVRMDVAVGAADLKTLFLEGEEKGTTWGIQDAQRWIADGNHPPKRTDEPLGKFVMPALHYLAELPIRSRQMTHVTALPDTTINGQRYHRVLATWNAFQPNESDQYVFFIRPEDGWVAKAFFTVREFASFAKSTVHYDDLRRVDGALVPFKMTLTGTPDEDIEDWLHQVEVESVEFDRIPLDALQPLDRSGS